MQTRFFRNHKMESRVLFHQNFLQTISLPRNTFQVGNYKSIHFIVTDETVDALYGNRLERLFKKNNFLIKKLVIPAGESSKSFSNYKRLSENILAYGVDRESTIIGFGGGVVNNLAGFLASTIYRGVRLIQIPTTLLSQLDATIDFKQAINSSLGKNHIGSFYPASLIIVDPFFLSTLPHRHIQNGLAESIKHGLTHSVNLFKYLNSSRNEIMDLNFLTEVIHQTVSSKIKLLNDFDFELSEMTPQYGHPIGHALEYLSKYKLLHGEALAIGMCVMTEISHLLKICAAPTKKQHYNILQQFNLPTVIPKEISNKEIIAVVRRDKHFVNNAICSVLVDVVGSVAKNRKGRTFEISLNILERALILNRNNP